MCTVCFVSSFVFHVCLIELIIGLLIMFVIGVSIYDTNSFAPPDFIVQPNMIKRILFEIDY